MAAHGTCRRLSLVARFALAAACGAVAVSFVMTLWALAGLRWTIPILVIAALALCALLRRLLPASEPTAPRHVSHSGAGRFAIGILVISTAAAFIATASGSASSADLILFWGTKSQAFAAARTIDPHFLGDPLLDDLHPSYPPLVTNIGAFASLVAGRFACGAATLVFPLLLGLMAFALPSLLRLATPQSPATAYAALAVSATALLGDVFDIAGNGDMPLLFFEALAAALLIGPWALKKDGQLFAGLMLSGAVSAKVEGLAFALGIGGLFLLLRRRQIRFPSALLRVLVPPALCLATWFVFGASRRLFFGYQGYGRTLDIHWERIGLVAASITKELWTAAWTLPFALPVLALLAARGPWRAALIPVGTAGLLAGFFFFTYLHGDPDPGLWIHWSAGRIFLPLAVLVAIGAAARADPRPDHREAVS